MYKRRKGNSFVKGKKKTFSYDGIDYKSGLELYMAQKLSELGIHFSYEPFSYILQDGFYFNKESYERQSNQKGEFKQRGKKKILPITYTIDFVGEGFLCETKGYQNEQFTNKWKAFKKLITERYEDDVVILKPQTEKEVDKAVEIILSKEQWKDVEGFEGLYKVSNYGRVLSCERKVKSNNGHRTQNERILLQRNDKDGYKICTLSKDSKSYTAKVHRLVTTAFLSNPDNLSDVNHLDEVKSNNGLSNLEWSSHLDNMKYSNFSKTKKPVNKYNKQNELVKKYQSLSQVREDGFSSSAVSQCCNGMTKSSGGFIWKYEDE